MFSFSKRRSQVEVHKLTRRLIDSSCPTLPPLSGDSRWEDRANRTIPVLLAPIVGGELQFEEIAIALTKNLSGQGLALVLHQPFWAEGVIIGFWHNGEPEFVRGEVRQNAPLGGGFWQLGIELTERVTRGELDDLERLVPLTSRLDPHQDHAAAAHQSSRNEWRP
jgi:hypothetical protein